MSVAWASNGHAARRNRLVMIALGVAVVLSLAFVYTSWDELPRVPAPLRHFNYGGFLNSDEPSSSKAGSSSPSKEVADHSGEQSPALAQSIKTVTVTKSFTTTETATETATATATAREERPDGCVDPYRRPGYMSHDADHDYNDTRYVPYDDKFLDSEPPSTAQYPYDTDINGDLWFNAKSHVGQTWIDRLSVPTPWLNLAMSGATNKTKQNKTLSDDIKWVNGRVVLAISDSVDRFNMNWFCSEFKDRGADPEARWYTSKRTHGWGVCHVPSINVTLIHWHLAGMLNYHPTWWWDGGNIDIVPFEERWDSVWNATSKELVGLNGKGPDLVLWQSALWERKMFQTAAKEHYSGNSSHSDMWNQARPLVWSEVRFHAARVKVFLQLIRDRLGKKVPVMLRTVTVDRDKPASDIQLYELDRINRAVNAKAGNEVFEWGKIVAGHTELYLDHMHLGHGASSWLWGTMVLEYLARAVGVGEIGGRAPYFDGWESCHKWLL